MDQLMLGEWAGAVSLAGFAYIAWWALGRVAQHLGTGRLQVLGLGALIGWLLG